MQNARGTQLDHLLVWNVTYSTFGAPLTSCKCFSIFFFPTSEKRSFQLAHSFMSYAMSKLQREGFAQLRFFLPYVLGQPFLTLAELEWISSKPKQTFIRADKMCMMMMNMMKTRNSWSGLVTYQQLPFDHHCPEIVTNSFISHTPTQTLFSAPPFRESTHKRKAKGAAHHFRPTKN